jgi:UDP-GlcNAc3NAcA epimerase
MKKIVSIIGARPQFIKCAPLSRLLREHFIEVLVHTGQHYDRNMSALFFEELEIPKPDYNLGIGSGSHAEQTGRMLMAVERVLVKERPDLVLIYGDTNSTVAGALAAVKLHIPVAHVEAGLRSFNREMPEEHNRVVADHLSDLLFVPSRTGMENLKKEGLGPRAFLTGDIMFDALKQNLREAEKRSVVLEQLKCRANEYYLATLHRPSNTDDRKNLRSILRAFSRLDRKVVFPLHPRTRKFIRSFGLSHDSRQVRMIAPVGYLDMLVLTRNARKVLTDSGGLQKEAFYLGREVIVLREESEWRELVSSGMSRLAGAREEAIVRYALSRPRAGRSLFPYGRGDAANRIVTLLRKKFRELS